MDGLSTAYRPSRPVDLAATLAPLRRGSGDPCQRLGGDGTLWRTLRTPIGPVSLALRQAGPAEVAATAWGPGAPWALGALPDLLGARDPGGAPAGAGPRVAAAARRHVGLRVPRCGRVLEMLVPAVLEQQVTGFEARRAWRYLLHRYGEPAPGPAPAGLRVFPPAETWHRVPAWEWHRAGVAARRAGTVRAAAEVAGRLEETVALASADAVRRLQAVPGVGPWTAAEVSQRAYGDLDAVSVGDYHLPAYVGWALAGRPVDEAGMLALLEPYRPQRYRAIRLLEASGFRMPRFGPRLAPPQLRR